MWMVGNGESINVWTEPWLFDGDSEVGVRTEMVGELSGMRVCDLLVVYRSEWNLEKLETTFDRVDVNKIRTVSISPTYRRDVLSWIFKKNDLYATRSGYFDTPEREISAVTGTGDDTH